ncbi:MAG: hypothetical protein N2Z72_07750 [Bacteroidales bacterium]|nr:hypothetical protein [Bacteroidales bacterium]
MRKKWLQITSFLFLSISFFLWNTACSTRKKKENSTLKDGSIQQNPSVQKPDSPFTPPVTKYGVRPAVKYGPPPSYDTTQLPKDTSR